MIKMVREFEIINRKKNVGTWIDEQTILKIIRICNNRSPKFTKEKLIPLYEKITEEKFKNDWLK